MIQGHGDDAYRFDRPIRANFSSNVYGRVDLSALQAHLKERLDAISHYPEPEPYTLEAALAARHGIDPQAVCVTNGATEAIYLTALAFRGSRSTILQPTFTEYADACRLHRHTIIHTRCRVEPGMTDGGIVGGPGGEATVLSGQTPPAARNGSGFATERCRVESGMTDATERCRIKSGMTGGIESGMTEGREMIWICNPNNPTGDVIPKAELTAWMDRQAETIFVIDQSYGFFTEEPLLTAAEAAARHNVIQFHSMTKRYAMPGLRLGYITANPKLLDHIRAVRMPWSVNTLAIEAGLYLCRHPETAPIDRPALLAETQRLREQLNSIPGLTAEPTKTHFFLCRLAEGRAAELKEWLAHEHGILIRDASNFEGLEEQHFRIATQTAEENDLLVEAIRKYGEDHGL